MPLYLTFRRGVGKVLARKLKIDDDQLIIIEGIHGLNDSYSFYTKKQRNLKYI